MKKLITVNLWLIVLILGLPLLTEIIYTPALPAIAKSLSTTNSMVEYTLTVYFLGFALGTLLWGKLSDRYGRKVTLMSSIVVYLLGCLGCFFSTTINVLLASRFIMAFGVSTGNVLGQTICRDIFEGDTLGKTFAMMGSILSIYIAVGPLVGGIIDQFLGWRAIFLCLIFIGIVTLILIALKLPETAVPKPISLSTIKHTFLRMISDKKILAYGLLMGACNGISSSYYAEGPFYLINKIGLSPSLYGLSYIFFAFAGLVGGYIAKKFYDKGISSFSILRKGNKVITVGTFSFFLGTITFYLLNAPNDYFLYLTLITMTIIMTGIAIMTPNLVSLALQDYSESIGTASSLFGFYYYMLIALFTFLMGLLHNNTIFPMPSYFLCIALIMGCLIKFLLAMQPGLGGVNKEIH